MFIHDATSCDILDVNDAMLSLYGYQRHEVTGLTLEDFRRVRALAPGGRRPLRVRPAEWDVSEQPGGNLTLGFFLPAGAYATVLLREVTKTPFAQLRAAPGAAPAQG